MNWQITSSGVDYLFDRELKAQAFARNLSRGLNGERVKVIRFEGERKVECYIAQYGKGRVID